MKKRIYFYFRLHEQKLRIIVFDENINIHFGPILKTRIVIKCKERNKISKKRE